MWCERLTAEIPEATCISRQKKTRARHGKPIRIGNVYDPGCLNCGTGLAVSGMKKVSEKRKCSVCGEMKLPQAFYQSAYKPNICRSCRQEQNKQAKRERKTWREYDNLVS